MCTCVTAELLPIVKPEGRFRGFDSLAAGWADCRRARVPHPYPHGFKSDPDLEKRVEEEIHPGGYLLQDNPTRRGRPVLVVKGWAYPLRAAYRLAEHLGVRFYLHGDVVPDEQIPLEIHLDETGKPLFALRGIQPFHDFPEGPDWWNRDDYQAIIAQLPKMRMNFFGLHSYPEGGVGPEPLVWIGPPRGHRRRGQRESQLSRRGISPPATSPAAWGYRPGRPAITSSAPTSCSTATTTATITCAARIRGTRCRPKQCNALFDRIGEFLGDVFTYAHRLGVKTCIGTETPLSIPAAVKERLKAAGKDPADPAVVQELYEGMFQRITKAYPLDYYWLWTPEGWTWEAVQAAADRRRRWPISGRRSRRRRR